MSHPIVLTPDEVARIARPDPKPKRVKPKKAKAKSKRTTRDKPKTINGGFLQRTKTPKVSGKGELKSRMMRVEVNLADYMRKEAKKQGIPITEVQRNLYHFLTD